LKRIGFKPREKTVFYKGKGCSKCNNTGYYGRFAILENLIIDDAIKVMILDRAHSDKNQRIRGQGKIYADVTRRRAGTFSDGQYDDRRGLKGYAEE